jgi:hypothetical protein
MDTYNINDQKCPEHGLVRKFIPPTKTDLPNKKMTVTFECPERHLFTKEFELK